MGSGKPAYAAAKSGIISFTKTLPAQYVHYGIRANAIGVGTVRTDRTIKRYQDKEWMLSDKPSPPTLTRMAKGKLYPFSVGDPPNIAAIAMFLASDESRMIAGTTIAADGAHSAYIKVYADYR